MKKKFLIAFAIAVLCVGVADIASATTLDFEGMQTYSTNYINDNYNFHFSFAGWYIDKDRFEWNQNGTTVLNGQGRDHYVDISLVDGSIFSLSSIDAAIMWDDTFDSGALAATGTRADGSSVSMTFTLGDDYNTFSFTSGFTNLSSLRLAELGGSSAWGSSSGISIDNLEFGTQVPEPATMLLLGVGLIGLAGARRKFKK